MVYLPTESPNGLKINKPSKGEGGGGVNKLRTANMVL